MCLLRSEKKQRKNPREIGPRVFVYLKVYKVYFKDELCLCFSFFEVGGSTKNDCLSYSASSVVCKPNFEFFVSVDSSAELESPFSAFGINEGDVELIRNGFALYSVNFNFKTGKVIALM